MIEFFKKQNELKHASLARRQFVLEAEEHARFNFSCKFCRLFYYHFNRVETEKIYIFKAREK